MSCPNSDIRRTEGKVSSQQEGGSPQGDVPSVRTIDSIFRESDRLYYEVARGCGLSNAAFWSLVSIVIRGGATQGQIAEDTAYSRQTVNSAVKSLESRGLVAIGFEEGSRRNKTVSLTSEGTAFCARNVRPAMDAEERAFASLSLRDRREFARLVRIYVDAIDVELSCVMESRLKQKEGGGR
ncbi:winged helix-turn-helix transcriptional regulator [Olsenella umbonata]|uniref:Winged helix-turn-helix transcriptional regulator n=1 Tax=Parafannyhessea umbonata TaxID=604330 RepID=A0A6N7WX65_9ACTN|nr:winged helix-turn-helix transcriptional regulator [Parafannyhessea umbonata]